MVEACGLPSPRWPIAAAVALALLIDRWLGEPSVRWHPVVWMGHYLGWTGCRIAPFAPSPVGGRLGGGPASHGKDPNLKPFVLGFLAWWVGVAIVLIVSCAVNSALRRLPGWAAVLLLGIALKPLLAWRLLQREVLEVEAALASSLAAGRARLARLVSRDVSALSTSEVRESTIESLAENLNDSVVAPVFWFALFGLPGAALYRFANTADAMWGYRGERGGRDWTWAGKWAARADDVLSWVPARLTALLLALTAWRWPRGLTTEARRTLSPNSGWPMAAMALLHGVRLGKPGVYTLNATGREPTGADVQRSAAAGARVVLVLAGIASLVGGLMATGFFDSIGNKY
ncbi:MAG: cobalamin biosynthesis protein CobD [Burkholderiaceae bacterium]|nr:MAG: cobalamin biosynthesis protein CobD [Burkholderiaceae bacterium]TBR73766.1 MAG: cobalamin biosynthesis protein CobD [Burkholderiaceae bacterium]